jgi:hypothetical protein
MEYEEWYRNKIAEARSLMAKGQTPEVARAISDLLEKFRTANLNAISALISELRASCDAHKANRETDVVPDGSFAEHVRRIREHFDKTYRQKIDNNIRDLSCGSGGMSAARTRGREMMKGDSSEAKVWNELVGEHLPDHTVYESVPPRLAWPAEFFDPLNLQNNPE